MLGIRTKDPKLRKVKPLGIGDHEVGPTHQPVSTYSELDWYREVGFSVLMIVGKKSSSG